MTFVKIQVDQFTVYVALEQVVSVTVPVISGTHTGVSVDMASGGRILITEKEAAPLLAAIAGRRDCPSTHGLAGWPTHYFRDGRAYCALCHEDIGSKEDVAIRWGDYAAKAKGATP